MEAYRFENKEPLTQRVVLALRVDTKQKKEYVWLGAEYDVEDSIRGLGKTLYWSQTRPLGTFWCEFGKTSAEGWPEAVWALHGALSERKTSRRTVHEQKAAEFLSQLAEGNVAARYAAIQIWEMYLRCTRGRNKEKAQTALLEYAQRLILPFGEYTPEMVNWKRERPVFPIWNYRADAKLEIWYPSGKIPFECAIINDSLRPALIYYRQRILDAGLLMRTCTQCGRIFFASDSRSSLCSERCRKSSKKAAKKSFDDKSKEEAYEQAYKREYMFWYNRVKKLEKNHAPQEQIQSAKAALKQFRKEAVERKKQIQSGELSTVQFMNWMIGQEPIIQKICVE